MVHFLNSVHARGTMEKHFIQVYDKNNFHIVFTGNEEILLMRNMERIKGTEIEYGNFFHTVFMKIREESHVFRRAFTFYFHQPGADRSGNCRM